MAVAFFDAFFFAARFWTAGWGACFFAAFFFAAGFLASGESAAAALALAAAHRFRWAAAIRLLPAALILRFFGGASGVTAGLPEICS